MTHDSREALDSLLAFRHGDTKHLTAEHARILYEALTASPGEQQPVAWCNGDEFDNMLDDRAVLISRKRSGWRNTPLYTSPPPAAGCGVREHKWFDHECQENGCQSLVWKDRYESAVKGRADFRNAYKAERDKAARLEVALSNPPAAKESEDDGWRDDPSADGRWNAGLDFAMQQFCTALGVDPAKVTWDAATETVEGDVQAVIRNILRARFGEDWGPATVESNDSVEARLREALEAVRFNLTRAGYEANSIMIEGIDNALSAVGDEAKKSTVGLNWELSDETRKHLDEIEKCIVRPGDPRLSQIICGNGDEATKSEGGATLTFVRRLVDDPNSASGKSLQDVEVRPSSPTADVTVEELAKYIEFRQPYPADAAPSLARALLDAFTVGRR